MVSLQQALQHPYLASLCVEQAHVLIKAGRLACEADPDLEPGRNCCAVCCKPGSDTQPLVPCPHCRDKVLYCGVEHAAKDGPAHSAVCDMLRAIGDAAAAFPAALDGVDALVERVSNSAAARGIGDMEGWEDVLPAVIDLERDEEGQASCHPRRNHDGEGSVEAELARPLKRARLPPLQAVSSAADSRGSAPTHGAIPSTSGGEAAPSPGGAHTPAGAVLRTAVTIGAATLALSYPLTLVKALAGLPGCREAGRAVASSRPFVVTVLGASADAELEKPFVWKALTGIRSGGVVLQMVGPQVAETDHLAVATVAPGVKLAHFQGEYHAMVGLALPRRAGGGASGGRGVGSPALSEELALLPDVVVGFNMGLTCPDYDWQPSLKALSRVFKAKCEAVKHSRSSDRGTKRCTVRLPWLHTANTELEGLLEREVVTRMSWRPLLPPEANPFTSLEPLQSGTLANDVYRKNGWWAVYELSASVGPVTGGGSRKDVSLAQRLGGLAKSVAGGLRGLLGGGRGGSQKRKRS